MDAEQKPRDIKERAFDFAVEIVRLCHDLDKTPGTIRTLGKDSSYCGSGTSIGANVKEAQASQSRADFISKYSIALGQTSAGRYLIVFFVRKKTGQALTISARDMSTSERKRYEKK